jgi:hypothetical protein
MVFSSQIYRLTLTSPPITILPLDFHHNISLEKSAERPLRGDSFACAGIVSTYWTYVVRGPPSVGAVCNRTGALPMHRTG